MLRHPEKLGPRVRIWQKVTLTSAKLLRQEMPLALLLRQSPPLGSSTPSLVKMKADLNASAAMKAPTSTPETCGRAILKSYVDFLDYLRPLRRIAAAIEKCFYAVCLLCCQSEALLNLVYHFIR